MAQRKAASVLPLPVGARISVDSPRAIAGQPCACGGVGAANDPRNQSATAPMEEIQDVRSFAHVSIISALRRRLLSLYSACYLLYS